MSEIAGGGGSGGGGEAAVLSLKINTGAAAADLALINTALDRLALERKELQLVNPKQTEVIKQQQAQIAQLSNELQKANAQIAKFNDAGGKGPEKLAQGLNQASGAAAGLSRSVQGVDKSLKVLRFTNTEASGALGQGLKSVTGQFNAISNAARSTSSQIKSTMEAMVVPNPAITQLNNYFRALQTVGTFQERSAASVSAHNANLKSYIASIGTQSTALQRLAEHYKSLEAASSGKSANARLAETTRQYLAHYESISRGARSTSAQVKSTMEAMVVPRPAITQLNDYYRALQTVGVFQERLANSTPLWRTHVESFGKQSAAIKSLSAHYRELEAASLRAAQATAGAGIVAVNARQRTAQTALGSSIIALDNRERALGVAQYRAIIADEALVRKQAITQIQAYGMDEARAIRAATAAASAARAEALNKRMSDLQKLKAAEKAAIDLEAGVARAKVVTKYGASAVAGASVGSANLGAQIAALEAQRRALGTAGAAAQQHAAHVHALNLGQQALHATLRGVTGVLGGLWLSYAKLVPVLLAAAAATKAVKDSVSGGLDTTFQAQFIATVDTSGLLQGAGLKKLRDEVLRDLTNVARDSVFSVEQNADALQKLSLAGVEASRGIGLLETATNAAVFAQKGLGETTGMILDTLYNFNLASGDAGVMADNFERVADIMSYTAITVNAGFDDIAKSFQNVVGVAGSFNIQIEEAAYLLQNLAQAGIRGQKAGTYVRNFLDDLLGAPISRRAEAAFAEKGIERFDASKSDEYAASKYIDSVIAKVKTLNFIEQQDFLRAVSNQRSRRVWRQELLASYDKEATMLSRVSALAQKAEGSLATMAEGLKGSGKYALQMAQSAYNAAGISAFQSVEADDSFAAIGKQLQNVFNSKEYAAFMESVVRLSTDVLQSLTNLFDYLVQNGAMIRDVLSGAFDLALLGGFAFGITKAIGMLKAGFIALAPVAAMLGKTLVGAFSGIGLAISAAIAKMLDFSSVAAKAAKVPPVAATAPVRMSPANAMVGLGASAIALGAGILLIRESENAKLDHANKSLEEINRELAEIQKRRANAEKADDYTGFATYELNSTKGLLERERSLLAAKAKLEETTSRKIGDEKAKSFLQNQIADIDKLKETYNQAQRVISAGLLSPEQAGSLAAGASTSMLDALTQSATELDAKLKSLAVEYQQLAQVPEGERNLNRMRQIEQESDAIRRQRAEYAQTHDDVKTKYSEVIENSIFSHLSQQAADLGLKGSEAVSKTSGEIQKALADITSSEEGLAIRRQQSAEIEARMMAARAASLREQADRTSDPNLVRFLLDQAEAASAASVEYANLAKSQQALIDGQAWAAGKGPMTEALIDEFDTSSLEDYAAKLKQMNDLAGLTTEALQEMTIAALGVKMAEAFEEGDIERGNALAKTITELNRQFSLQGGAVDSGSAAREKLIEQYEAATATLDDFIRKQYEASGISRPLTAGEQFTLDFANQYGEAMAQMTDAEREYLRGRLEVGVAAAEFADSLKGVQESLKDVSGLEASVAALEEQYLGLTQGEQALRDYQYAMAMTAMVAAQMNAELLRSDAALDTNAGAKAAELLRLAAEMDRKAELIGKQAALQYVNSQLEGQRSSGGGGSRGAARDPIREAIEAAKTAVQDYKNTYQEAMGVIGEQRQLFEIGPSQAYAESIATITENYDAMIAAINKAKSTPGIRPSEVQTLTTDEKKLIGERAKAERKANEDRIKEMQDMADKFEQSEIAVGRKVLSASESWMREYQGKFGDTIKNVAAEVKFAQANLEKALDTGAPQAEVDALRAKVAQLQDQLQQLNTNGELGAWAAGVKEAFEQAQTSIDLMVDELGRIAERSSEEGLFGVIMGTPAQFEAQKARSIRAVQDQIDLAKRNIQRANDNKQFNLVGEYQLDLQKLEGQLADIAEEVDPTLQGWGDSLGNYLAEGLVNGFDQGESPAKAFGNYLKAEVIRALASAMSKQFVLNMTGIMGGGAQGGVAAAANSAGGTLSTANSIYSLGSNAGSLLGLTGSGAAAGTVGMANMVGAVGGDALGTLIAGNSVGWGTSAAGLSGGSLTAGIGAALPWLGGGLAIASMFGAFDKKPSNRAAGGTVDLDSGETTNWEMQGKKAPDQGTRDARTALLTNLGVVGRSLGAKGTIGVDIGGRDGIQIDMGQGMKSYGTDINTALSSVYRQMLADTEGTSSEFREIIASMVDTAPEEIAGFITMLEDNFSVMATSSERFRVAQQDMNTAFADLGVSAPTSVAAFKDLAASQDLTTQAGRDLYEGMVLLAPAFLELQTELDNLYTSLLSPWEKAAQSNEELNEVYKDMGVEMPKGVAGLRALIDAQDLSTEAGQVMRAQLLSTVPAMQEFQDELLSLAGISGEEIATTLRDGMLGRISGEDVGGQISTSIIDGLYNSIAGGFAQSITNMMVSQVITPLLTAAATGAALSGVVSQATMDSVVEFARNQMLLLGAIFDDPEFQGFVTDLQGMFAGIGSSIGGAGGGGKNPPVADREINQNSPETNPEEAWRKILEQIVADTEDARRTIAQLDWSDYDIAIDEIQRNASDKLKELTDAGWGGDSQQRITQLEWMRKPLVGLASQEETGNAAKDAQIVLARARLAAIDSEIKNLTDSLSKFPPEIQAYIDAETALLDARNNQAAAELMKETETTAERWLSTQNELNSAFAEMGVVTPSTVAQFRELLGSVDSTTESGRQLQRALLDIAPTFLEAARAVSDALLAISESGASAIDSIRRSVMTDTEEYTFNDSKIVEGRDKYGELLDPAAIQKNFDDNLALILASWALIPEEVREGLADKFETVINDETRIANERLAEVGAPSTVVISESAKGVDGGDAAERISAAVEAAMDKVAANMMSAGDKQNAAALTFADAAASIPSRIIVQNNVTLTTSEIGR